MFAYSLGRGCADSATDTIVNMTEKMPAASGLDTRMEELDALLSGCGLPPVSEEKACVVDEGQDQWDELLDSLGSADAPEDPAPVEAPTPPTARRHSVSGALPGFPRGLKAAPVCSGVMQRNRIAGNVTGRISGSGQGPRWIVAKQRIPKCDLIEEQQAGTESEQLIQACVSEAILREQQDAAVVSEAVDEPCLPAAVVQDVQASAPEPRNPPEATGCAESQDPGDFEEAPIAADCLRGDRMSVRKRRERHVLLRDLVQRKLLDKRAGAAGANAFLKSLLGKIEDNCHLASADLNRLIRSVQQETGMLPQGSKRRLRRRQWIAPWAATCLVGLTSCAPFVSTASGIEVQQLQHLAIGVERFIEREGHFPEALDQLSEFPDNAVLWPIELLGVRNGQGLNEVSWVADGAGDFAIILRTEDRTWVRYDEGHVREMERRREG